MDDGDVPEKTGVRSLLDILSAFWRSGSVVGLPRFKKIMN
jgi:hypothetical protein